MAVPVIRSVTATPTETIPGGSASVFIDAFDPDARTLTLTGTATDTAGSPVTATTTVVVGDALTYELTCDDETVTVVQDPVDPARFTVTVPV